MVPVLVVAVPELLHLLAAMYMSGQIQCFDCTQSPVILTNTALQPRRPLGVAAHTAILCK